MNTLQLSISAIEEKSSFIIQDCTGFFPDKPNGWGVHTAKIEDISDAFLEITPPPQNTPIINPVDQIGQITSQPIVPPTPPTFTINTTGDFPNKQGAGYEILPYMVGNSKIVSGKWKIKMTITGLDKSGKKYTKTAVKYICFTNDVICCVDKLGKHVNANVATDKKQQTIIELNNLVESMCYANGCGLLDQADEIIRLLGAQCQCAGC